jgi:hypothetical protein
MKGAVPDTWKCPFYGENKDGNGKCGTDDLTCDGSIKSLAASPWCDDCVQMLRDIYAGKRTGYSWLGGLPLKRALQAITAYRRAHPEWKKLVNP